MEEIGRRVGRDPSTVSYWVQKHGLVAANRERHAARGGLSREDLAPLVEAGASIAEIAGAVQRSKATVRHWLRAHGLKTSGQEGRPARTAAAAAAKAKGLATARCVCKRHGLTDFTLEGRGYYRCKKCRAERVVEHRRRAKATLVSEAGGRCALCGYDRSSVALEFHHRDPSAKSFGIAFGGMARGIENLRAEASKCVLLCSNCHAEVEAGLLTVP